MKSAAAMPRPFLAVDNVLARRDITRAPLTDVPKELSLARFIVLELLLHKIRQLLHKLTIRIPPADSPFYLVRYTSVPLWKPWRDY